MRPLVISPEIREQVAKLVKHAIANPIELAALRSMKAGTRKPVGDDPAHVVTIPLNYRCVYSHEMQPAMGRCRHLSISVTDGRGAGIEAVHEISKLFGFKEGTMSADHIWMEDIGGDRVAVNLIQRVLPGDET